MTPPEKPETKTDSSPTDAGSSAPPPWQRVASDVQRAFEHTREAGSETVRVEPVDASSAATAAGSPPAAAPAKTTATASETAVPATQGGADTPGTAAGQSGAGTETAPKTTVPKTTVPANKTVPEQKTTVTENKPTPRNRDAATVVSPLAPGRPAATPAPASAPRNRDAKTERFEDWGYTKARKSTPTEDTSGTLPTAETPEVGGYAGLGGSGTSSVYAGQRVGSLPRAESGIRTSVNLGTGSAVPGASTPIRPASPPNALRRPGRGPRRASLQVRRVDPWSVLKLAFVLSVALFFVWMVAVGVLYGVLDGMGVWDKLNGTYNEFAVNTSAASGGPLITVGRVLGVAAIVGAINIVLITALATVGAFVYNVSADLAGGLEMTLAERE